MGAGGQWCVWRYLPGMRGVFRFWRGVRAGHRASLRCCFRLPRGRALGACPCAVARVGAVRVPAIFDILVKTPVFLPAVRPEERSQASDRRCARWGAHVQPDVTIGTGAVGAGVRCPLGSTLSVLGMDGACCRDGPSASQSKQRILPADSLLLVWPLTPSVVAKFMTVRCRGQASYLVSLYSDVQRGSRGCDGAARSGAFSVRITLVDFGFDVDVPCSLRSMATLWWIPGLPLLAPFVETV